MSRLKCIIERLTAENKYNEGCIIAGLTTYKEKVDYANCYLYERNKSLDGFEWKEWWPTAWHLHKGKTVLGDIHPPRDAAELTPWANESDKNLALIFEAQKWTGGVGRRKRIGRRGDVDMTSYCFEQLVADIEKLVDVAYLPAKKEGVA